MKPALLAALLAWGCAETPSPVAPVSSGHWVVAWLDHGSLVVSDVCDEQTTDAANERVCRERASEFNREDEECGGVATGYFAMWRAE